MQPRLGCEQVAPRPGGRRGRRHPRMKAASPPRRGRAGGGQAGAEVALAAGDKRRAPVRRGAHALLSEPSAGASKPGHQARNCKRPALVVRVHGRVPDALGRRLRGWLPARAPLGSGSSAPGTRARHAAIWSSLGAPGGRRDAHNARPRPCRGASGQCSAPSRRRHAVPLTRCRVRRAAPPAVTDAPIQGACHVGHRLPATGGQGALAGVTTRSALRPAAWQRRHLAPTGGGGHSRGVLWRSFAGARARPGSCRVADVTLGQPCPARTGAIAAG